MAGNTRSPLIPGTSAEGSIPAEAPAVSVSVVLPVLNEERDIGRLLGEVLSQEPPAGGFELLVVDGGSSDSTRGVVLELAFLHPNLRLLDNPGRLSSAGRNVGAREARGKYVLYLDGHCAVPRKDYLRRMQEIFEATGAACLCRPQPLNRMCEGDWAKAISAARHSPLGHNPGSDIYGGEPGFTDPQTAGAAYTREAILDLGGYDERFDACEDVEFNMRVAKAGLPAFRHPDLTIEYRPRSTPKGLFRQMERYGRGRGRLMARHPGVVPWPLVLITGYLLAAMLSSVLGGLRVALPAFGIPAVAVALLVAGESIRLAGLRSLAPRVALSFFVIYAGLLLGFWKGLPEFGRYRSR